MSDDRYDKVTFRNGKTVDKWTRAALLACEKDLGYELTILQGSYSTSVGASAGTHAGGGACDLAPYDWARKVKVLRTHGFAAWHRPHNWDGRGGGEHIHCELLDDARASSSAKAQWAAYKNHRNGLANNAPDNTWRPNPIKAFDYAASQAPAPANPTPEVPVTPIPNTLLRVGYGNMFGPPPPYKVGPLDRERFKSQLELIHHMRVSMFIALECHEENGSGSMLAWFRNNLPTGWKVAEGKGGNHLFYDGAKYTLLAGASKSMGTRWASKWNLKRIDTGLAFWVTAFHTPAGNTPARILARQTEVKNFLTWTKGLQRVVVGMDKNNDTAFPGSPTKQLADAGIKSLYTSVTVANAQYNSHHDTTDKGKHIDFLGCGPLGAWTDGEQVRTAALSDHDWLVGDITLRGITTN